MGRNQQFFPNGRPMHRSAYFELDFSLEYHHELIDRVTVIFPDLPGCIGPDVAAETARLPGRANGGEINHQIWQQHMRCLSGGVNEERLRLMSRRNAQRAESKPTAGNAPIRPDLIERGGTRRQNNNQLEGFIRRHQLR